MKRVLLIEDLSCYGKCSMTVALPLFSAAGIEVVPLPTAIFSTHTGVSRLTESVDFSEKMKAFISHFKSIDLKFDAILIGYSYGNRQLQEIGKFLDGLKKDDKPFVLVDPAMADHGKMYGKLPVDYSLHMKELIKKADILTPNLTEALILANQDYTSLPTEKEKIADLLFLLYEKYKKELIITGAHIGSEIFVLGISEGKLYETKTAFIGKNYSGTGDAFATLFLTEIVKGKSFDVAMKEAAKLTSLAVKKSMEEGKDHLYFEGILYEIARKNQE